MPILTVGIRDFRARLSYYLAKAKSGEIIKVTSRGKLVAHVFPPALSLEERTNALQKAGIIAWSGQKLPHRKPVAVNLSEKLASDIVIEMRD